MIKLKHSRNEVVNLIISWVGKNEKDGSYKSIIDIYNSYKPLPRNTKMQYGWAWCAATWSAVAIKLGYTDIMPIEMSCSNLISIAKKMGIWVESDKYIPKIGDGVLYDWNDNGVADCTGDPDHIGIVTYVNQKTGYFVVIEGNYSKSVKKRTVAINGRYIRGFITPKYDENTEAISISASGKTIAEIAHEVIVGVWGSGDERQLLLKSNGLDPDAVQKKVNEILNGNADKPTATQDSQDIPIFKKVTATVKARYYEKVSKSFTTTSSLYLRNGAGTNMKALCLMPKGTKVNYYGYYGFDGNSKWCYVTTSINGVQYTGFCHSKYLN